jgi:sec-independent protein translocase protein TatB
MFDISWTEFLVIGVVALIVIGPKELPTVMRTLGQWTRKMRNMASDFQNQFQEAIREAEMSDLKKQVDDMAEDIKSYDPLKSVRDDVETIGKDVERPLDHAPAVPQASKAAAIPAETVAIPEALPAISEATASPAVELVAPAMPALSREVQTPEMEHAGSGPATAVPQAAAEAVEPGSTGRTG